MLVAAAFRDVISSPKKPGKKQEKVYYPLHVNGGVVRKRKIAYCMHANRKQINSYTQTHTQIMYLLTHMVAEIQFNIFQCNEKTHTHTHTIFEVSPWVLVLGCY